MFAEPGARRTLVLLGGGFIAFFLLQQKGWGPGDPARRDRPALLLFAGSSRRSGCVPAEPYPPLKQILVGFPFPFPAGSKGSSGWESCEPLGGAGGGSWTAEGSRQR